MKRFRQCFAAVPAVISLLASVMLICLLLLVMVGEDALSFAYSGLSFVSSRILGVAAIGLSLLLMRQSSRAKPAPERPVWQLAVLFGLVLIVQFVIARSCWFPLAWDPGASHTAAEEIARGLPLSMPDYFKLCPNNAPLTVLLAIPLWVAVKIGLAVPYVVLPYINAVLLNLSAFAAVLCVRKMTRNSFARGFALTVSIGWIALSPYILYPYTDTFSIPFPVLALLVFLYVRKPVLKWFLISLLCFFGASIKPTVLIVFIALAVLGVCSFLAQKAEKGWWKRAAALLAAVVLGAAPGLAFQRGATVLMTGSAKPEEQLSMTHYLMLGMNGETCGGHSQADVEFSQSFDTLAERQKANLQRAWERVDDRSITENIGFLLVKAYKAYADGSFASHSSFLEMNIPERKDAISIFLRRLYHKNGDLMLWCQTLAQMLWLGMLVLCAAAAFRHWQKPAVALLCLTLIGLTAYLLLFEVWPRYLFLYAPFFVILSSLAFDKPDVTVVK